MAGAVPKRWIGVVGFPPVGFVLLWWASEQWALAQEMALSASETFSHWRVLGWMITLMVAGIVFGLAAAFARAEVATAHMSATIVAGILPLALAIRFWAIFAFEWIPGLPMSEIERLLVNRDAAVASCLVVGFLAANLLSHRIARSTGVWLVEVND